ncbi:isoprenoid synthase domain-containing protein [Collybia nuda]|uniref:Isoprenoid synthase domain-containing protein n=1 Tax=Collybia nuda TaxID=64659 RepID=A0A9P5XZ17_9AGAR|nr:isoprenoid synthase domain-containing protein [Collybia nuda]
MALYSLRSLLPTLFSFAISPISPLDSSMNYHTYRLSDEEIERSIYRDFLRKMEYCKPDLHDAEKTLEQALRSEMYSRKMQCPQLEKTVHLAARLVELAYPDCTFEEQKVIALVNWFVIYLDDVDSEPCAAFVPRLLRGQKQLDPVLDAFADVLNSMHDYYDSLAANQIVTSILNFINLTPVESQIAAGTFTVPSRSRRFPGFLRDRSGLGVPFALFAFPKSQGLDTAAYLRALPDMDFWICAANDLLSYHKEMLAGETNNYVSSRALVEKKTPLRVLVELERELEESRNVIHATLSSHPAAIKAWRAFEVGGVAWHLEQKRYKLKDLALDQHVTARR